MTEEEKRQIEIRTEQILEGLEVQACQALGIARQTVLDMKAQGLSPDIIAMTFLWEAVEAAAQEQECNMRLRMVRMVERTLLRMEEDLQSAQGTLRSVD